MAKKSLIYCIILIFLCSSLFVVSASSDGAEPEEMVITMVIDSFEVKRGEQTLPQPPVAPQIVNGRTMLPYEYLLRSVLGGTVNYDAERAVIKALVYGVEIRLFVDAPFIEIGDSIFRLDQSPLRIGDHILVPLRAMTFLTASLTWDAATQTVTFTPSALAIANFEQRSQNYLERGQITVHTLPDISNAIVDAIDRQLEYNEIYSNGYRMGNETQAEYAHRFLQTLCSGDPKAAMFLSPSSVKAYDFIGTTTFAGYEIVASAKDSQALGIVVRLTVIESDNTVFPVGQSLWDLTIVRSEATDINLFAPHIASERAVRYGRSPDSSEEQYAFCARFSLAFGIYDTCYNFAALMAPYLNMDNHLHHLLHYYDFAGHEMRERYLIGDPWYEAGGISSLKVFLDNVAGTSGIDYSDFLADSRYGYDSERDATEMSFPCAHGGSWLYWQPVSSAFDEAGGVHTTVINYYSDAAHFLVARTLQYSYRVNADETFTMLSIELLYDSGNPLMYGNI